MKNIIVAAIAASGLTVVAVNYAPKIYETLSDPLWWGYFPTACSDATPAALNSVLANSPMVKMTGTKVLVVTGTRDLGSRDTDHLSCSVSALLSSGTGTQDLKMRTDVVNGQHYITVSLF